jgi:hypothetical protein
MAEAVYILCAVTSALCAALLLRSYRSGRSRLILWTSLCFVGLALNNSLLVVDIMVVREVDLSTVRGTIAALSGGAFLLGLIWEAR